ncbi:MAG: histidine kinase, partial [Alistipes sp.]|nr:histidine kinase [Alistipes sp.]
VLWHGGGAPTGRRVVVWLAYFAAMDILVYLNIYLLAKPLLLGGRVQAYMLWAAGLVAVFILTIGSLQSLLPDAPGGNSAPAAVGLVSSVAAIGLLFAGTTPLVVFQQWIGAIRRTAELESANAAMELQVLKNQINPHFLFNMLNNCYLLVKKRRPDAREILFRLEELLRYQIAGSGRESVTIAEEAAFLGDLLSLEKIRRDSFGFEIRDTTSESGISVPPMLFIPFVENAVKHSGDSDRPSRVDISFSTEGKVLLFECTNSKPERASGAGEPGGLGLDNIRRRLELLFPGRHRLEISETAEKFSVTLKLEL